MLKVEIVESGRRMDMIKDREGGQRFLLSDHHLEISAVARPRRLEAYCPFKA